VANLTSTYVLQVDSAVYFPWNLCFPRSQSTLPREITRGFMRGFPCVYEVVVELYCTQNTVTAAKEASCMDWICTFVTKMMLYKTTRCHQEVVKHSSSNWVIMWCIKRSTYDYNVIMIFCTLSSLLKVLSFKLLCTILFTVYTCFVVCMQVQQDLAYLNSTVWLTLY